MDKPGIFANEPLSAICLLANCALRCQCSGIAVAEGSIWRVVVGAFAAT